MSAIVFGITGIGGNSEEVRIEINGGGELPDFVPPIIGRGVTQFGHAHINRSVQAVLLFYNKRLNLSRVRAGLVVKRTGRAVVVNTTTFLLQNGRWEQPRNTWSNQPLRIQRL